MTHRSFFPTATPVRQHEAELVVGDFGRKLSKCDSVILENVLDVLGSTVNKNVLEDLKLGSPAVQTRGSRNCFAAVPMIGSSVKIDVGNPRSTRINRIE